MPVRFRSAWIIVAALLLSSCATAASMTTTNDTPVTPAQPARIIVKLRDARLLDATYNELRRQAEQAGAALSYVRALHDNVHLYAIGGAGPDAVARLVQRFGAHPNVVYVEPDRIMRHQAPRPDKQ